MNIILSKSIIDVSVVKKILSKIMKHHRCVFGFGGGTITKKILFALLIVFSMALFSSCVNYATNETQTENITDLTGNQEISDLLIDNSTSSPVNTTIISENISNVTKTADQAAGENPYTNVSGIWISTGDVNNVNVTALVNANITDIFVKSNLISSPTYQSILTTVIQKFTGTGIRIHAWIVCFIDANDKWINPANETQRTFLLNNIIQIVKNYNIDGIHLDYVRYPGTAYNYTNGTETITSFVKDVYNTIKSLKPDIALSAALMPEGSVNGYYYGQDYAKLAPYLDFLVPMIYKGNYNKDTAWIGSTTKYIVENSGGKPVLAGIQTYESDSNRTAIPSDELNSDINSALNKGASGYVLFRYGLIDNSFFNKSPNATTFTVKQIKDAASTVRDYIETYHKLPSTVNINGTNVTMSQFLELSTTALLQINSGNNNPITLKSFSSPTSPIENIHAGNIPKAEFLKIANDVKNYMDSSGKTPDFAYQTSLGTYLRFENLVYMYSMILDYHQY